MAKKSTEKQMEKETEKLTGRPNREFDKTTVEGLCHVWCTWEEIENILRTDRRTLDIWCQKTYGQSFSDVYNRYADGGKASLRRNQFNLSKTNAAMGIWLGKQRLGQKEDPQGNETFNGELKEFVEFLKHKYSAPKEFPIPPGYVPKKDRSENTNVEKELDAGSEPEATGCVS